MKVRDVINRLRDDGWYELSGGGGSHRQFKHPRKKGRVTVAGHPSEEMHPKTLKTIWQQAGLEP